MLKARHHWFIFPFFRNHALNIIKRHFAKVHLVGELQRPDKAVLLISNHMSWWDGFWALYLNLKVFKKKFYFMMLEEQLLKHRFLNYCGGYSVTKKSRSILDSLHYTNELLADPGNLVLIFPQGEIQSMHLKKFAFDKGIERILQHNKEKIELVFLANITDYFSLKKPSLWMYYKSIDISDPDIQQLSELYTDFYMEAIEQQIRQTKS